MSNPTTNHVRSLTRTHTGQRKKRMFVLYFLFYQGLIPWPGSMKKWDYIPRQTISSSIRHAKAAINA